MLLGILDLFMSATSIVRAQRVCKTGVKDFSEVQRALLPVGLGRHGTSDFTGPITLQTLVLLIMCANILSFSWRGPLSRVLLSSDKRERVGLSSLTALTLQDT